jgi:hypothetical protein
MQGKTKAGVLRIILGVVTFGVIGIINMVKGIILGINVLKMDDAEFQANWKTITSGIPSGN